MNDILRFTVTVLSAYFPAPSSWERFTRCMGASERFLAPLSRARSSFFFLLSLSHARRDAVDFSDNPRKTYRRCFCFRCDFYCHIFSGFRHSWTRVVEEKNWSLFLYFSSCTGERLLDTKLFGLSIYYNFSAICKVNVTHSPSLTAFKREFWRDLLLRQCLSIIT